MSNHEARLMARYSRKIEMPKTMAEGLQNTVQMIINQIEADQPREALLTAVDLLDTLRGNANPYAGVINAKPAQALIDELRRIHKAEMVDARAEAFRRGEATGRAEQRRALIEKLGLNEE